MKMVKPLFFFFFLTVFLFLESSLTAGSIAPTELQSLSSLKLQSHPENARSCSYKVIIKTSCSSVAYTRDKISIAFGDAYGNEVYVPRLDDPHSRAFERCSTDTYQIPGPCTHDICYLHFLRSGSDGWKPENVKIYGQYIKSVTFFYNTFLPNGVWYGFDECRRKASPSAAI